MTACAFGVEEDAFGVFTGFAHMFLHKMECGVTAGFTSIKWNDTFINKAADGEDGDCKEGVIAANYGGFAEVRVNCEVKE